MNRRRFHHVLVNTCLANISTSYLWFAVTFWVYLETRSVLATSVMGGAFMLFIAVAGVPIGSWVDRARKKSVMVTATVFSGVVFSLALGLYLITPPQVLLTISSWQFMLFIGLILSGAVVESARNIALSTCVTLLIDEPERARANGLVGMIAGLGFTITSVFSGLSVGRLGMTWTIVIAVGCTLVTLLHLLPLQIPEPELLHTEGAPTVADFGGAFRAVREVPGLTGLILFAAINNVLGGAFVSLMDPYGLNLVSVEVWGLTWGVLSLGFIIGAGLVARRGLGPNPLRVMLWCNVAMWSLSILFPIREHIWLLVIGVLGYMALIPVVEAAEQTLLQKVVPFAKQGRVFGLAQTVELAAAPFSAFLVGPLAEFWLIPYANSDAGREQLGWLLGAGQARGIALVFLVSGLAGLLLTLIVFTTKSYRWLSARYAEAGDDQSTTEPGSVHAGQTADPLEGEATSPATAG